MFSHGERPGGRTEAFCVKINTFQNQRKERVRNENGQLGAIEYTILELPKESAQKPAPVRENPIQVRPMLDVSRNADMYRSLLCSASHPLG